MKNQYAKYLGQIWVRVLEQLEQQALIVFAGRLVVVDSADLEFPNDLAEVS